MNPQSTAWWSWCAAPGLLPHAAHLLPQVLTHPPWSSPALPRYSPPLPPPGAPPPTPQVCSLQAQLHSFTSSCGSTCWSVQPANCCCLHMKRSARQEGLSSLHLLAHLTGRLGGCWSLRMTISLCPKASTNLLNRPSDTMIHKKKSSYTNFE